MQSTFLILVLDIHSGSVRRLEPIENILDFFR